MQRRQFIQASAFTALTTTSVVWAQSTAWPDKPIKFVLSQPPGSGPDNVARLLGERLTKSLGQAIVIDNKPGGQNVIGAQAAARSTPDGYTFYFATTAALITNALLFKQLAYDPQKDFVPVAFIARSPFAILVDINSPIQTLDDLIAKSKASGGQFSIGNEGPRTFSGMIARLFNARAKASANLVPYANVGVGSQNLMGGHVDSMVADLASTAQLAKQGKLRVIATTAAKRVPGWESVPAIGLAKQNEEIYRPGRPDPLVLPHESGAIRLLQRVRDEAHRVANGYHQLLMKKRMEMSELDSIPGVSGVRKRALLKKFGTVGRVAKASVEELAEVEGVGEKVAAMIAAYFVKGWRVG